MASKISSFQVWHKWTCLRKCEDISTWSFYLFSTGSHLRYFSLKTEQNKVKVIGCGKRYSPIHQIKRPNLTRKIGDDVNATTPYPESQTTTSSNELTITLSIGGYSLKFCKKEYLKLHKNLDS